jgi:hypothetical protein
MYKCQNGGAKIYRGAYDEYDVTFHALLLCALVPLKVQHSLILPPHKMNTLVRPLRSTFNRSPLAARHRLSLRPAAPLLHVRTEASSVGLKPGSQSLSHARQNIKEEAGNSASDLAKAIAGANVYSVKDASRPGFVRQIVRVREEPVLTTDFSSELRVPLLQRCRNQS